MKGRFTMTLNNNKTLTETPPGEPFIDVFALWLLRFAIFSGVSLAIYGSYMSIVYGVVF